MAVPFRREPEETDRLLALSDAVVGIAITLLVLEITVPTVPAGATTAILPDLVAEQWHELAAYVLSFLIIGQYWVLHRRIFVHVDRHDRGVLWLNLLFLLMVAFVPYATNLFTTYPGRFGVTVYAGVLAATGLTLMLLWGYASRNELLEAGLDLADGPYPGGPVPGVARRVRSLDGRRDGQSTAGHRLLAAARPTQRRVRGATRQKPGHVGGRSRGRPGDQ